MDQKNTIVKCYAHPNCLFNHNGVCDNYVISIGEDRKCDCYVETEEKETSVADQYSFVEVKGYKQGQPVTFKIAEFNKPNKNQSIISDWDYAAKPDICKTCRKVVYGHPCQHKNVINGVWTCYEEEIDEV